MPGFSRTCINCARTERTKCQASAVADDCPLFLSWPDFYRREIATCDRSMRVTWLASILMVIGVALLIRYLMP
jgi:hypothetical protein